MIWRAEAARCLFKEQSALAWARRAGEETGKGTMRMNERSRVEGGKRALYPSCSTAAGV